MQQKTSTPAARVLPVALRVNRRCVLDWSFEFPVPDVKDRAPLAAVPQPAGGICCCSLSRGVATIERPVRFQALPRVSEKKRPKNTTRRPPAGTEGGIKNTKRQNGCPQENRHDPPPECGRAHRQNHRETSEAAAVDTHRRQRPRAARARVQSRTFAPASARHGGVQSRTFARTPSHTAANRASARTPAVGSVLRTHVRASMPDGIEFDEFVELEELQLRHAIDALRELGHRSRRRTVPIIGPRPLAGEGAVHPLVPIVRGICDGTHALSGCASE